MNMERRAKLTAIAANVEAARMELEEISQEERDAFDNMPESLQQGDRGQASEAAADAIDEAVSQLDEACSAIGSAVGE